MRYLLLAVLFLASCAGGDKGTDGARIIEEPGVYVFPEHNLKLNVSERNSLISINVTDTIGTARTSDTFPEFTALDEWTVYVDSAATVWLQSADIGTYTLSEVNGAYAVSAFVITRNNQRLLPNALKVRMPGSLNKRR